MSAVPQADEPTGEQLAAIATVLSQSRCTGCAALSTQLTTVYGEHLCPDCVAVMDDRAYAVETSAVEAS
jgi:hypothetical protein